jgi:hypothetical protein
MPDLPDGFAFGPAERLFRAGVPAGDPPRMSTLTAGASSIITRTFGNSAGLCSRCTV